MSEDENIYTVYTELTKEEKEYNSIASGFEEFKKNARKEKTKLK